MVYIVEVAQDDVPIVGELAPEECITDVNHISLSKCIQGATDR